MLKEIHTKNETIEGSKNVINISSLEEKMDEKPFLSVSIDMDDGKSEKLIIMKNEDIKESVNSFAIKHQLSKEQTTLFLTKIFETIGDNNKFLENGENVPSLEIKKVEENSKSLNSLIPKLNEHEGSEKYLEKNEGAIERGNRSSTSIKKIQSKINNFPLIDENSKRIAKAKGLDNVNVFQRLTLQAAHKRKSSAKNNNLNSQSLIKHLEGSNLPTQVKSVMNLSMCREYSRNTYLYDKGIKTLKEKMELSIKRQKEKEENELSGYTFAPKINNNFLTKRCNLDLQDSVISLSKIKNPNSIQTNEEIYSFKPNLSLTSKKINGIFLKDNVYGLNRFDKLYHDAKEKAQNIERIQKEVNFPKFAPSISILDQSILKKKVEIEIPHHTRLALKKKKEKLKKLANKTTNFIPEINHNYPIKRDSKNVNERLYKGAEKQKFKLDNSIISDQKKFNQNQKLDQNDHSNKIIYDKRNMEFTRIFNSLDSEKTGKINSNSFQNALSEESNNKLLFLIKEDLQKSNNEINCSEFCLMANKIFIELTPDEKNEILFKEKNRKNKLKDLYNIDEYKPQINQMSLKMLSTKNQKRCTVEKNYQELSYVFNQKVKYLQNEKEKAIMKNCTFQPCINKVDKKQTDKEFLFDNK